MGSFDLVWAVILFFIELKKQCLPPIIDWTVISDVKANDVKYEELVEIKFNFESDSLVL